MPDILFDRRPGALVVTLNRPESRNTVSQEMTREFYAQLLAIEHDPSVRCVLLRGAGDHFMAGGNVKNFSGTLDLSPEERRAQFEARVHALTPFLLLLERMPQIFVCAVRGACAGVGLSWVAAADLAIASKTAFFLQAQIKIACTPDGGGSYWPVRAVGLKRAKEIALLGERFSAEEAAAWGLINRVVEDAQLDAEADKLVERLAAGSANALARTKRLVNAALDNDYATQLAQEAIGFSTCASEPDFAEGIRSFLEKRPPRFGQGG